MDRGFPFAPIRPQPGYTEPLCTNGPVQTYSNTGFSLYDALQTSLTMRNFHGWTGTASYTYSRGIDNASEFAGTGTGGGTVSPFAQNPLNTDFGERGVSGYSYPSIWGVQTTYTEPWFSNQHGILGRILGGYSMNGFFQYNGGTPFNPIQNSFSVASTNVLADIAGASGNPGGMSPGTAASINQTQSQFGFCDVGFSQALGKIPAGPCCQTRVRRSVRSVSISDPAGMFDSSPVLRPPEVPSTGFGTTSTRPSHSTIHSPAHRAIHSAETALPIWI